jgi:hypothetical protein
MDETQRGEREAEEQRELEREQLGGPADYESGSGSVFVCGTRARSR